MTAKELARFQQLAQFQHEEYGRWLQLLADVQGKPIAAPDPQGAPAPVVVAGNAGGAVVELKTTSTRTWRDVAAGNDSGGAGELKVGCDCRLCGPECDACGASRLAWTAWRNGRGAVGGSKARSVLRMAAVQQKGVADVSGVISAGSLGD